MTKFLRSRNTLQIILLTLLVWSFCESIHAQNCNGIYGGLDNSYNTCTGAKPAGTQVMTFDGEANGLSFGVWIRIDAVPSGLAYVLRVTLDASNDANSANCKVVSIELDTGNKINVRLGGGGLLLGIGNRFNNLVVSLSGYTLNKWYWIFASRVSSGLLGGNQCAGIYDPGTNGWLLQETDPWGLLIYIANLAASGFMVFVNGFNGVADGFCGKIRGISVMPGVALSFDQGFEYMSGQQPSTVGVSGFVLYMPFDAKTGQQAIDVSSNANEGIMGSSIIPDLNDPTWETSIANGLRFTNSGQPTYIQLPLITFLGTDTSVTVSFTILLNAAPSCTAPVIQRVSESGTIIFGIVVKGTLGVSLIINGVETPLSITLSLASSTSIVVMCTTYGGALNPKCKAYKGFGKTLGMTTVAVTSWTGSSTDKVYIGDPTCGFDGYLKDVTVSRDGNVLDVTCSNCKISIGIDTSSSYCLTCTSKVEFNGVCLASCGSGFLLDTASNDCYCPPGNYISGSSCLPCSTGCDGCTSSASNACLSCVSSRVLTPSGTCGLICPAGTYPTSAFCAPCDPGCVECTGAGPSSCSGGCNLGYFQQPAPDTTTCLTACPTNYYYPDSATRACLPCHSYCKTCTGSAVTQCPSCDTGYYLLPSSTTCVVEASCPIGTYPDSSTNICQPCHSYCAVCTGPAVNECSQCNSGYYRKQGTTTCVVASGCPALTYPDTSSNVCESCHAYCTVCTGAAVSQCSQCATGYFLLGTTCVVASGCSIGTYPDSSTKVCESCHTYCNTCTGPSNIQCPQCASGYFQVQATTTCLPSTSCPAGTYPDTPTSTCKTCHPYCSTCTGASNTQCPLCATGYFQLQATTTCVLPSSCPTGTFPDTATSVCQPCNTMCSVCTGAANTQCSQCSSGYFLVPSTTNCVVASACPTSTYPDSSTNTCKPCNPFCSVCTGPTTSECSQCASGFYLILGTTNCVISTSCPTGTYPDSLTNVCQTCHTYCSICTGPAATQCTQCAPGFFLQQGTTNCVISTSCPSGTYPDTTTNTCQTCSSFCSTCTGPAYTQCSGCAPGYYMLQGTTTCVVSTSCPAGTYPDSFTNTCSNCINPCFTCTGATSCTTCVSGYYIQPAPNSDQCATTCPSGYFLDTTVPGCVKCAGTCLSCVGPNPVDCTSGCPAECSTCLSYISCTSCAAGFYLSGNQCVAECPPSNIPNPVTRKCMSCPNNCQTCGQNGCAQCTSSHYLFNNTCYIACPAFTYESTVPGSGNLTCGVCHSTCLTCKGPTDKNCTLCQSGYFFFNNECLLECPSGTYETKITMHGNMELPICALKVPLTLTIKLTSDPRQVQLLFSDSVGDAYLEYFLNVLQVTLGNALLDSSLYAFQITSNSTITLALLTQSYYPANTQLIIDLLIGADFDTDPTNKYTVTSKSAVASLAEYYPFTPTESDVVSAAAKTSKATEHATTAVQAASIVATGGITNFLLQIRLITDLIQLQQFLDIAWPPNVVELYKQAYIDPSNLFIPVCFCPEPEEYLLPNMTLSRVLQTQEISPIFLINNCYVISTLVIGLGVIIAMKVWLQFKKPRIIPQKLADIGTEVDKFLAWNAFLQIFISNFPLYFGYSILQLYYSSFISDYTRASFALSVLSVIGCTTFLIMALVFTFKYSKAYLRDPDETKKKFRRCETLFDGTKTEKRIHFFQLPINMLRMYVMVVVAITFSEHPWVSTITLTLLQCAYIIFVIRVKSQPDKIEFIALVVAECLLLGAFGLALGIKVSMLFDPSVDMRNQLGWIMISINFAVSITTCCLLAKQVIALVIENAKKISQHLRRRRNQISPTLLFESRPSLASARSSVKKPIAKSDLTLALENIDSIKSLLRSNLSSPQKSNAKEPAKLEIAERPKLESMLQKTLNLLDVPSSPINTRTSPSVTFLRHSSKFNTEIRDPSSINFTDQNKEAPSNKEIGSPRTGTIILENIGTNGEGQSSIERSFDTADKELTMLTPQDTSTLRMSAFKRYFFPIHQTHGAQNPAQTLLGDAFSEYMRNPPESNGSLRLESDPDQNEERDRSNSGPSGVRDNQKRQSSIFLKVKKEQIHSRLGKKKTTQLSTLQILPVSMTDSNSKSLDE